MRDVKRLLNREEQTTNEKLKVACAAWSAHVFVKVRLADVLHIEGSGITDREYRFALQSHFDFVVTDAELEPLFVVEFDGPTHESDEQRQRDEVKNSLAERFSVPLLRVHSRFLTEYRDLDLLTWFIECWFLLREFRRAQGEGRISPYEEFDPSSVLLIPGREALRPLGLSLEVRARLEQLFDAGRLRDPGPSYWVGSDNDGNVRGLAYIRVSEHAALLGRSGLRAQQFEVPMADVAEDLAVLDLWDQVSGVMQGTREGQPLAEVASHYWRLRDKSAHMLHAGTIGGEIGGKHWMWHYMPTQ